mgnify:CR=1 FL=1
MLKRAVESVLGQSYRRIQLVISDNASNDGTQEYLASLSDERILLLLSQKNEGMVVNWDRCVQAAAGEFFLLLSDDDAFLDSDALEKMVSTFMSTPTCPPGFVFSDVCLERPVTIVHEATRGELEVYTASEIITHCFENRVSIFPCATLLRRQDIVTLGGYGSFGATLAVDACVWISLALKYGRVARVDGCLSLYRIHQSLSSSSINVWDDDYEVMENIIAMASPSPLSTNEMKRILRSIRKSRARLPVSHISNKLKYDSSYGVVDFCRDVVRWRKLLFLPSNLWLVFDRVKKNFFANLSAVA